MASFTDSIQSFNPYIQQLPVEQMASVGVARQQLYDRGVQKIQQQIDSVAGLDIIKDVDKQYLQSKLNSLGDNLKIVAAGDFSNFQLTNSVGGMVNRVGKDANIQNAVYSTAHHRKEMSSMEAARGKGEFAPENEWDYQKKFEQYYTSDKVGEQFNGRYSPYVDVNKKILAIGKEIGIDETTMQLLWQTDEKGEISRNPDGTPKWNPVMAEKHLKGKDASKLLNAFKTSLTAADYNQLSITGRYLRAGLNPEELAAEVSGEYNKNISAMDSKLHDVEVRLAMENSANNKNYINIKSLEDQRDALKEYRTGLATARDRDVQSVNNDPERVKGSMYINNYVAGMATALSSLTEETTYKVSPHFEVNMALNKEKREIERNRIADSHWMADYQLKLGELGMNQEKQDAELYFKYGMGKPPKGFNAWQQGVDLPINTKFGESFVKSAVESDYLQKTQIKNENNKKLVLEMYKETEDGQRKGGELTDDYNTRLTDKLNELAKDANPNDINEFYDLKASELIGMYNSGGVIPKRLKPIVKEQKEFLKGLDLDKAKMDSTKKKAVEIAKNRGLNIPDQATIQKEVPETSIKISDPSTGNDTYIPISSTDLVDFVLSESVGKVAKTTDEKQSTTQATQRLKYKFGEDGYQLIKKQLITYESNPYSEGGVMLKHPAYKKAENLIRKTDYEELAKIESEIYKEKGYVSRGKSFPVMIGDRKEDDVLSEVNNVLSIYKNDLGLGGAKTEDLTGLLVGNDPKKIRLLAIPGITPSTPVTYQMEIDTESGQTHTLNITPDNFTYLSKMPEVVNEQIPVVNQILSEFGTTGTSGTDNYDLAYYTNDDFINIDPVQTGYTVAANFIAVEGNSDYAILKLYIKDRTGRVIPLQDPTPININSNLDLTPSLITPQYIEQLQKSNK